MSRADRIIATIVLVAIAVSIVHYTDNYTLYEEYPTSDTLPNPSQDLIGFAWFLFTAFALAGLYFLWTATTSRPGSASRSTRARASSASATTRPAAPATSPGGATPTSSPTSSSASRCFACALTLVRRPREPATPAPG